MTKKDSQKRHARKRAFERAGIELGRHTHDRIIAEIKAGRSTIVEKQSNRVTVHDVCIGEQTVRVVYDRQRHELVTFLPTDEPVVRTADLIG